MINSQLNLKHLDKRLNMAEIDNLYKPTESLNISQKFEEEILEPPLPAARNPIVESNNIEPVIVKETNRTDFYDLYLTKPSKETEKHLNDYKKIDKSIFNIMNKLFV